MFFFTNDMACSIVVCGVHKIADIGMRTLAWQAMFFLNFRLFFFV